MDIEKWSKKAKIAGLTILTVEGLVLLGHIDPKLGTIALIVVASVYLAGQSLVDMIHAKK